MSDYKSTLGPIDPLDDDLLASGRPGAERQAESSDEETAPVTNETTPLTNETTPVAEDEEAQSAITSRDPAQALLRMGWALVVAVVICTVVLLVGILRVSSAVDNVACVTRAQANLTGGDARGASAQDVALARLGLQLALKKCH